MNSPAVDVKDLLVEASIGLTFGTDLFVDLLPEKPDACVCVVDTTGEDPIFGADYDKPHVQVIVRGARGGYTEAYGVAEDVKDVLSEAVNETVNSTRYIGIWIIGDVNRLGLDDTGRPMLSLNFRAHRTPSS